jgi:glycosyltransferase involved in cell wall biosynthesis
MSFVVPAYNEEENVERLLSELESCLPGAPIILVDNGSQDRTAAVASQFGARVLTEPRRGKGWALHAGIQACRTEFCFTVDADLRGLSRFHVSLAESGLHALTRVVRLSLKREAADAPVTRLLASPLLSASSAWNPSEPLGGMQLVRRDFFLGLHLAGGWGVDVGLCLGALASDAYSEVQVEGLAHRRKPLDEYGQMSREVAAAILQTLGLVPWSHSDCVRCGS